jgi:hypothetical protein
MTVKSSSTAISSRFDGSARTPEVETGFCARNVGAIVPPWVQCTSAGTPEVETGFCARGVGAIVSPWVQARYWLLVAVLTVQFVPHRKHIPSP